MSFFRSPLKFSGIPASPEPLRRQTIEVVRMLSPFPPKAVEEVGSDPLHARIGSLGSGTVGRRMEVTRRDAQAVGPPDRGRVEAEVPFRAGIDRGGVGPFVFAEIRRPLRQHLQAGNPGWLAVPLPADEPRDAIAV